MLEKKVSVLEQEKAKAEAEHDMLKKQVEELTKTNEEIKTVMIRQAKKLKKMKDGVHDNTQLFELLSAENVEMREQMKKLQEVNQMLNGLISDLHEATSNDMKAMKLEMEAMKADKVMKDEQLNMLYTVMESHLNIDVNSVFNNIEIKRAEERRIEREKRLAEEATQKKKYVIVETQEVGGSSSQADIEMVDVEVVQAQGFVLVGESSPSLNYNDMIRRMLVEQRRRKAKDPEKLLKWKDEEVIEEEEDEEEKIDDELFDYIDTYPEGNNDDDQGSSGLLIVNPSVQQKIEDFMNDEINEQEEDHQQESSSSGKQHVDQKENMSLSTPKKLISTVEEASDSSDEETNFHYSGVDETFPSLAEMFKYQNEDEMRRKIVEKITTEGVPRTIPRENLAEERKKWFKVMPKERKFIRPLQYFTHDANISWGDILSWGYLQDLQVHKDPPWWNIDELVQTKNIKQFYYGLEVKQHDQHLWDYVKPQSKARYPNWKPQYPKQLVTILENGEKDVTLDVKPPRCLKNMPLRAMEQDFYEDFEGWLNNETTAEAVISLFDKSTGKSQRISILDPMWLYQKIVDVCFAQDIKSDSYWKSKWRVLEIDEFLKKYKREQRSKAIAKKAAKLGRYKLMRPPPTDQTPFKKEENKIPKWDRKRDGDPVYRKWWIEEGRLLMHKMLEEKAEQRRQRAKERRRKRKE
ncbi:hypothetical protein Hanom_Chr14g01250151 [Helianthus anomalus]